MFKQIAYELACIRVQMQRERLLELADEWRALAWEMCPVVKA